MWSHTIIVIILSARAAAFPVETVPLQDVEGGWVLNRVWTGYMGVAIQFHRDGSFDYWFYSDVVLPDQPKYPIKGKWKWVGAAVELEAKEHVYDSRWHVYRYRGEAALLPGRIREWQLLMGRQFEDRLLFRIARFDPEQPFANRR